MSEIMINPLDFNSDVAIGLKIPLYYTDNLSFNINNETLEHIKTKLRNLIFTKEGERVMNPTFGCNFDKVLFEPTNSVEMESYIRTHIEEKIKYWIPEVEVKDVIIKLDEYQHNAIDVLVVYSVIYDSESTEQMSFSINTD